MSYKQTNQELFLRNDYPSSEAYQAAIDDAVGAELDGFERRTLSSDLIAYEKLTDERIARMVFFNKEKNVIYITYTFDPFDADDEVLDNESLLYFNFTTLFAKYGKDFDEQIDVSYGFFVDDFFSMIHFRTYMAHLEKTLQRILT